MTTREQELPDPPATVAGTINVNEGNNSMPTIKLTTPPGCPWWCELPAGHPYDPKPAPGELTRHHQACVIEFAVSRTVFVDGDGRASVAIEAYEAVTDGELELQPPIVATRFDHLHELDVEDCRRMATRKQVA